MSDDKKTFKSKLGAVWGFIKRKAAQVWAYLKVAKMEYIVMISLFALDLITKAVVNECVAYDETVVLIPKFLNIHNYHNYDAAFGSDFISNALGSVGSRILFSVFAVAASVVFIIVLIKHKGGSRLFRISLAMMTAGAMGNCIDRWALGYVRDFIEFVYFGLTINGHESFYIFNFADAELVIAVVLIVIYFIFIYKDKSDEAKSAHHVERTSSASADTADVHTSATDGDDGTTSAEAAVTAETADSVDRADGDGPDEKSGEAENINANADGEAVENNTSDNNSIDAVDSGDAEKETDDERGGGK